MYRNPEIVNAVHQRRVVGTPAQIPWPRRAVSRSSSVLADLDSKAITNQSVNKSPNLPSKRQVNPLNADQRKRFAAGECQARVARLVPLLLEHISPWNSSSKIILRCVAAARRHPWIATWPLDPSQSTQFPGLGVILVEL
ncbi:hypothetical protein H257_01286 [Aphanomyces astaci]|uniref:Uncharacterized protein n=1 Tax=Aphanomyces astaci TaxID=112090 RepID=W4H8G3_APHAT|nr:hypothetical protein H257_01286 [Aphanomyces astaci]ETV87856.1 hypothetical protein H257_01286 [Aphanomyces astaci]|eukprot:XP_009822719.1 hypothetical protein H257_01286 [Aphanomyces astaci]